MNNSHNDTQRSKKNSVKYRKTIPCMHGKLFLENIKLGYWILVLSSFLGALPWGIYVGLSLFTSHITSTSTQLTIGEKELQLFSYIKALFGILIIIVCYGMLLLILIYRSKLFDIPSEKLKFRRFTIYGKVVKYIILLNEHPGIFQLTIILFSVITYIMIYHLTPQNLRNTILPIEYIKILTLIILILHMLFCTSLSIFEIKNKEMSLIKGLILLTVIIIAAATTYCLLIHKITVTETAVILVCLFSAIYLIVIEPEYSKEEYLRESIYFYIMIFIFSIIFYISSCCIATCYKEIVNIIISRKISISLSWFYTKGLIEALFTFGIFTALITTFTWVTFILTDPYKAYQNYFLREVERAIKSTHNHYLVIGLGGFGRTIIRTLAENKKDLDENSQPFLIYEATRGRVIFRENLLLKSIIVITEHPINILFSMSHNVVQEIGIYGIDIPIATPSKVYQVLVPVVVNSLHTLETYEYARLLHAKACIITQAVSEEALTFLRNIMCKDIDRKYALNSKQVYRSYPRIIFRIRSTRDYIVSKYTLLGIMDYYSLDDIQGTTESTYLLLHSLQKVLSVATNKFYIIIMGGGKHIFHEIEEYVAKLLLTAEYRGIPCLKNILRKLIIIVIQPEENVKRISETIKLEHYDNVITPGKIREYLINKSQLGTWIRKTVEESENIFEEFEKIIPLWANHVKYYLWLPELFICAGSEGIRLPVLLVSSEAHKRGLIKSLLENIKQQGERNKVLMFLTQRSPVRADRAICEIVPLAAAYKNSLDIEVLFGFPKEYRWLLDNVFISNMEDLYKLFNDESVLERLAFPYQEAKDRVLALTRTNLAPQENEENLKLYMCFKQLKLKTLLYYLKLLCETSQTRINLNNRAAQQDKPEYYIIEFNAYPCFHRNIYVTTGLLREALQELKKFKIQAILLANSNNGYCIFELLACCPDKGPCTLYNILKEIFSIDLQAPEKEPSYLVIKGPSTTEERTKAHMKIKTNNSRCCWWECPIYRHNKITSLRDTVYITQQKHLQQILKENKYDIQAIFTHGCVAPENYTPHLCLNIYAKTSKKNTQTNTNNKSRQKQYPNIIVLKRIDGDEKIFNNISSIIREKIGQNMCVKEIIDDSQSKVGFIIMPKDPANQCRGKIEKYEEIPFCDSYNCRIANFIAPMLNRLHKESNQ